MNKTRLAASVLAGCVLCVATATGAAAAESSNAPVFALRDTFVGSMIPSDIATSPIPFDKTWAELTPQQKDLVRADYESIAPEDEPPFPEKGLKRLVWPLAKRAESTSDAGRIVAAVTVDGEGKARDVAVYKVPSEEIKSLLIAGLSEERFKPAKCKGQPCTMAFVLRVELVQPPVQIQRR
jgi:hypothetical protein